MGCSCNAAAYFTQMPGYKPDSSGLQVPYKGPIGTWYCDANDRNNNWCPEYDLIEANMYTMQSALHTCDYIPPKYYT